jgi:hypothetical protein
MFHYFYAGSGVFQPFGIETGLLFRYFQVQFSQRRPSFDEATPIFVPCMVETPILNSVARLWV